MMKTFLFLVNSFITIRGILAQGEKLELGQILPLDVFSNNPPVSPSVKQGSETRLSNSGTDLIVNSPIDKMHEHSGFQRQLSHKSSKSGKTESPTFFPTASPTLGKSSKSSR
ncbi:hypothetical protein ACHAXS_005733 [Conticribra weissflogii]